MLAGARSRVCQKCYEQERSGFESLRVIANAEFGHHVSFVGETAADGSLPRVNMAFLDVRFSNVCNFSCRTCGPSYSTAWYRYAQNVPSDLVRRPAAGPGLLAQVEPLLDSVEQIYFAGGEPTLIREHYEILERLIAMGRTDVRLSYSTNFSTFTFGRWTFSTCGGASRTCRLAPAWMAAAAVVSICAPDSAGTGWSRCGSGNWPSVLT
jgi:hypothetical protein